jgi:hypothetical protein
MLLQNLQAELAEAIINADTQVDIITPASAIAIYHNNVTSNFLAVLKETYPLICKLLGEEYFHQICKEYIKRYPSGSSNLHDYGEYFGNFLDHYAPLQIYPYLNEISQFEWASHSVFFEADHPELHLPSLQQVAPDKYQQLHFTLHPASKLLQFKYPILRIIDLCHSRIDETINLDEGGVNLLIIRRELEIKLVPLSLSEFYFLNSLQNNQTIREALDAALMIDSNFNINEKLSLWIKEKTIVDFNYFGG